jgi:hypothetical protein
LCSAVIEMDNQIGLVKVGVDMAWVRNEMESGVFGLVAIQEEAGRNRSVKSLTSSAAPQPLRNCRRSSATPPWPPHFHPLAPRLPPPPPSPSCHTRRPRPVHTRGGWTQATEQSVPVRYRERHRLLHPAGVAAVADGNFHRPTASSPARSRSPPLFRANSSATTGTGVY